MAIICCATPSGLYLEETRSTLQFASRAKLVKTRAQINEVLDDRSLIKKLQRELSIAKRTSGGSQALSQFNVLETEAENAKKKAQKLEKNLRRLKSYILRGGLKQNDSVVNYSIYGTNRNVDGSLFIPNNTPISKMPKKRRMSDSFIRENNILMASPKANISASKAVTNIKARRNGRREELLDKSSEMMLLKQAVTAKSAIARSLHDKIVECENTIKEHNTLLARASEDIAKLKDNNIGVKAEVAELELKREMLEKEKLRMITKYSIRWIQTSRLDPRCVLLR